jgi:predicted small metal-binding protein
MKKFACRDAGIAGCDWVVYDESEERVVARARDHAAEAHARSTLKDDEQAIRSHVRSQ